ncbi:TPA: succinate dehydrogenase [Clostridioides difficile]|uniref:succinate dehydrogenase n=1 Tax=Clostridioides difficile TaxID=1496 RepID=UPI0009394788|nr:succinate dehydrogenase [Clostridioides difficile]EGT2208109.1 succinate dehydrogenase [Clostridioides difficile]EGT3956884.1 succinate dehydrogenase [Clostridioides difficile]EGT5134736.1 succinate dehydrogenase [Clostridioides difficile]EGT5419672.1 succinate dehydrogenase [Clostridioides difficile]EKS7086790.1 succinate dehydrogenase [Clostridioides difficile]
MKRKLSTYFKGYILGLCMAFLLFTFILKKLIIENIIGIIIGTGIAFLLIYLFNKKRK